MSDKPLLNLLVAYPYFQSKSHRDLIFENWDCIRFVLDSGAFTAFQSGKEIKLDDYCRFLEQLPHKPWRYFTLDVIGNPDATMKNYETMLARGFNPVPIFTHGEDLSIIEDLYKTSDLIGIGGLVGRSPSANVAYLSKVMKRVNGRKVHWLGYTKTEMIKKFKPFMCDSSSFNAGGQYGVVNLYAGFGRFIHTHRTDFSKRPDPKVWSIIERMGYSPSVFRLESSWRGGSSLSRKLSAMSYVLMSVDIEKKLGTKVFCASTVTRDTGHIINAIRKVRKD